MIAALVGRVAVALTRYAHRHGSHWYLSTSCLHDQHDYCQSHAGLSGAKTPSRCKFCGAICCCRICNHRDPS